MKVKAGQKWIGPDGVRWEVKFVKENKTYGPVVYMDTNEENRLIKGSSGFYPILEGVILNLYKQVKYRLKTPAGEFLDKVHDTEREALEEKGLVMSTYGWTPEIVEV